MQPVVGQTAGGRHSGILVVDTQGQWSVLRMVAPPGGQDTAADLDRLALVAQPLTVAIRASASGADEVTKRLTDAKWPAGQDVRPFGIKLSGVASELRNVLVVAGFDAARGDGGPAALMAAHETVRTAAGDKHPSLAQYAIALHEELLAGSGAGAVKWFLLLVGSDERGVLSIARSETAGDGAAAAQARLSARLKGRSEAA